MSIMAVISDFYNSQMPRHRRISKNSNNKKRPFGQILIRMFLCIRPNLPIESANENTQNSEMSSACFLSTLFVLEKRSKKWYN